MLNQQALDIQGSDLVSAVELLTQAAGLDPFDREIAGNLGYMVARNGHPEVANAIAVYALSLPRPVGTSGRAADWQLLGSTFAKLGRTRDSFAAYAVGLAITTNLAGLCSSLLDQQADFGDSLKASVDKLFFRIQERGQSGVDNCAYPPTWRR